MPEPVSVNTSASNVDDFLPLMMCTLWTPSFNASTADFALGTIPPRMTLVLISSSISEGVTREMSDLSSRRMPSTSVTRISFSALSAEAISDATVSALMLRMLPASSPPSDAMTGTKSAPIRVSSSLGSIDSMSPTWPKSMISSRPVFSFLIFMGGRLTALMMPPSTPEMPTASAPYSRRAARISVLIVPANTITTTSRVFSSVMRRPWTIWGSMPSCLESVVACLPPPWTMTTWMPTW